MPTFRALHIGQKTSVPVQADDLKEAFAKWKSPTEGEAAKPPKAKAAKKGKLVV